MTRLVLFVCLTLFISAWAADFQKVLPVVADCTIYEANPNNANCLGQSMVVGNINPGSGNKQLRGLVKFDTSEIPFGSYVTGVSLSLTQTTTDNAAEVITMNLYKLSGAWQEGTTAAPTVATDGVTAVTGSNDPTWAFRAFDSAAWAQVGGDVGPNTTSIDLTSNVVYTITNVLIADVQSWITDPATNYGWLLAAPTSTGTTVKQLGAKGSPSVATLTVNYSDTPPGPGAPPPPPPVNYAPNGGGRYVGSGYPATPSTTGAIIGGVFGGIVAIFVVIAIITIFCRSR